MKKTIIALVATIAAGTVMAVEPLGYPGYNWSDLTYSTGTSGDRLENNNIVLSGKIEQGIDWKKYGDWTLNTYGAINYSLDRNHLGYNNKVTPSLGVKMSRQIDGGTLSIGAQLSNEQRYHTGPGYRNPGVSAQVYVNYWFGWNLKK